LNEKEKEEKCNIEMSEGNESESEIGPPSELSSTDLPNHCHPACIPTHLKKQHKLMANAHCGHQRSLKLQTNQSA